MKKVLLAILLMPLMGLAQTTVKDSMVMGANYANQVFYSLSKGTVSTSPVNNWHLAFVTNKYDAGIWANEAEGVSVWVDTFSSNFSKVDTTGMVAKWPQLFNSDTNYSMGALNAFGSNISTFNYGWGYYDYTTHNLVGNRVYVIKIDDGSGNIMYRKLKIELKQSVTSGKLNAGDIVFHYASLDSSVDKRDTMRYNTWSKKLMAYYNLAGDSFVNREPDMANWDLTMTHYITNIGIEYPVTGVFQNYYNNMFHYDTSNTVVAKLTAVNVNTVTYPTAKSAYKTQINSIGYDWVNFDMKLFKYVLVDSVAYFVKTTDGNLYKLYVTYFVGNTDGKMVFAKEHINVGTSDISYNKGFACHVAGNPVSTNSLQLLTDNTQPMTNATINIVDVTGHIVKSYAIGNVDATLHAWDLNVSNLSNGVYLIQLNNNQNIQAVTRAVIAR